MALCKYIRTHGARQFSVGYRLLSNEPDMYKSYKHVEKTTKEPLKPVSRWNRVLAKQPWNEKYELLKYVKRRNEEMKENEITHYRDQMVMRMQRLRVLLLYKGELTKYFKKILLDREIMRQSFLERRVDMLGPDIGAAHFIVNRGGRVKFWGHTDWITKDNMDTKLPCKYIPGFYVVAIDATGTDLYYEGVDCLRYLNKLQWLRLKGLNKLNDFALDIISGRYGPQLHYLDLTDCTGITHFGLSCCYRFKCLKCLNVTGLEHTPEFKLTCFMIEDLIPNLEIKWGPDEAIETLPAAIVNE